MNHFRAILFDLNGTLIDIWTDETREDLFRTMANLLNTFGVMLSAEEFRKLFYEIIKKKSNSLLILVGKGEDEEKIKCKIHDVGLEEKVLILIDRVDVNELYQAFDLFLLPSLYE